MVRILTEREMGIIEKKLTGVSLTQNESNILSKTIRSKLHEISKINAEELLCKIEYNQKTAAIENKINEIVLASVPHVKAIIICGSAVQTNYKEYKDIDLIIVTRKILTTDKRKKEKLIEKVETAGKEENLNLDIQIYAEKSIISQYSHSPSLIYQLKDSKVIYGKFKIGNRINLSSLDLRMKLDWSEGLNINSGGNEILYAIRNAMLVLLLMNQKVDNYELKKSLVNSLGAELVYKLRNNSALKLEKKLALNYLNLMIKHLEDELKNAKWEKIEILNP